MPLSGDWSNKAKFPPHMKPILADLAQKAIRTDCYTQPFFDRMPDIFPYNKFTITKLIKKENHPYYDNFLKEKRASLVTAFKKEVQVVVDERLESHKEAVQQWGQSRLHFLSLWVIAGILNRADTYSLYLTTAEEQQKAKLESEKDGLDPSTPPPAPSPAPVPSLQPSSFVPLANRSATPEPIPATLPGGGDGDDGPAGGSEKPPTKKFTFSYEMKQLLWQLHLVLVQTMEAQNDVNKYTGQAEMQLTSLNKGLYAEVSSLAFVVLWDLLRSLTDLQPSVCAWPPASAGDLLPSGVHDNNRHLPTTYVNPSIFPHRTLLPLATH